MKPKTHGYFPAPDIASLRVQTAETGDSWLVIAGDPAGQQRVLQSHPVLGEALEAAARLGGPGVTLCNQSVIGRLRQGKKL